MTDEKKLYTLLKRGKKEQIEDFYEYLYDKYKPLLVFISSKYLKDYEDIKDVVQETFVNFFNKLDINNPHTNIKSFLSVSCKNKAIDLLRKKKRIDYIDIDELDLLNGDISHESYKETISNMKKVLNEYEFQIIIDHLIYDMTFIDIAKKYNKSLSSIKQTYYQSIKKYKKES